MNQKRGFLAIAAVLALGLVPRLIIFAGGPEKIVLYVPDDAFYYFQIARNIVAGNGSTLDGVYATNGYHPLWMALLLPLAAFASSPLSFLKLGLAVGVAFNSIGAALLYRLLHRTTGTAWLALAGTAIYFLNQQAIFSSLDGLETSLSSLLFVVLLGLTLFGQMDRGSNARSALFGIVLGLLLLSRTDNVFYLIAFYLVAAFQEERKYRLPRAAILIGMIALVCSPWFLWNWFKFGSFVQSSGLAFPYVIHASYLSSGHTTLQMWERSALYFVGYLLMHLQEDLGFPPLIYQATIIYSLLVIARRWEDGNPLIRLASRILIALWVAGMLLVFVHTFVRWYPRVWYFDQMIILSVITVCFALALLGLGSRLPALVWSIAQKVPGQVTLRKTIGIAMTAVGMVLVAVFEIQFVSEPPQPHQIEMLDAADWLHDNLRQDESAAAFNAGIMSFFSDKRVVNLDGVVNNSAYEAIQRRDLFRLLRDSSVRYYLDYDPMALAGYAQFLGEMKDRVRMVKVQEISRPGADFLGSSISVYRLEWLP